MAEARRRAARPDGRDARLRALKQDLSAAMRRIEQAEAGAERARTKRAESIEQHDRKVAACEADLATRLQELAALTGSQRAAQELTGLPASAFRPPAP